MSWVDWGFAVFWGICFLVIFTSCVMIAYHKGKIAVYKERREELERRLGLRRLSE